MDSSIKKGFGFGLTSGVITTIGLMIGLYSSTKSKWIIIAGVLIIAIADSLSDAMGIHISEEAGTKNQKKVWKATIATFLSKFIFAISFVIPLLIFPMKSAIIIGVGWGLLLISSLSFYVSKRNKHSAWKVIGEHVVLTIFVIFATYYVGKFIHGFIH